MKNKLLFSICLSIAFAISLNAQNWNQILKTVDSDRAAGDSFGFSVSISGDYAVVGSYQEEHDLLNANPIVGAGSAFILQNIAGTWTQIQKIIASDRGGQDHFGYSVSISGDYIIVGAFDEDHDVAGLNPKINSGSAYIYQNIAGTWTFVQKIVASDRYDNDQFACSVSIDGNYAVVGAQYEDEDASGAANLFNSGSAYIYKNIAGTWTEMQKIVSTDRADGDYFGCSVDISNNFVIVGAYLEDENSTGSATLNNSGSAYIFENIADNWSQTQKIVATDRAAEDYFGFSVAIDGDYCVAGAFQEDENAAGNTTLNLSGSAYIFKNNVGVWSQENKIVPSDRELEDNFGYCVAIEGDYVLVGARAEDEDDNDSNELFNAGSTYIFKNSTGTWSEEQKIVSQDRDAADSFGKAIGISGNYIIVGVSGEDHDANGGGTTLLNAGSSYVFYNAPEIDIKQNSTEIASGSSYDFGTIVFGNSSPVINFTIESNGINDLILLGTPKIEISGINSADFSIDQTSVSSPISSGSTTSFTITYTPSSTGPHTAEISIQNNDPNETPYTITLNGIGGLLSQNITNFNAIPVKTYGDGTFLVSATASSGLDVEFTSSDPTVATCSGTNGTTITIVNAGSCNILANQPGDASYDPAPQVAQSLIVNQLPITITMDSKIKAYGDADPIFTYTYTPELVSGDSFSGSPIRNPGEDVGNYDIFIGSLAINSNYLISSNSGVLTIQAKPITVTANANQTKEYGQADPATYLYSLSESLVGGDSFTGALTRLAGENAGLYEIQQGSLALSSNYILSYVSDNFEISPKPITVTANTGLTKIYGTTDPPSFSYTVTGSLLGGDSFTGVLARVAGEDAGAYAIQQGSLALSSNYTINYVEADFMITQKPITLTIYANQSKQYGDADPVYNYWLMGTLVGGDDFSGTMSREPGEDLGFYAIQQGTYTLGSNYNLTFVGEDFEIGVKLIILTVDAGQSKFYGDVDPEFTYTLSSPLAFSDTFSGSMTRDMGEIVGIYAIQQASLSLSSNYFLMFNGDNFTINQKPITVTADPGQTKEYGAANPASYTYTASEALAFSDVFSGSLTRIAGENIGAYAIEQGSLGLNPNYILTYVGDDFDITPIDITVIANVGQSKAYGDSDPVYSYSIMGSLIGGDEFTGNLTRQVGEDVGLYAIEQGTLLLNSNYNLSFTSNDFEITIRSITVTADAGQVKIYGQADPIYTYILTGSLVGADTFTGELSRVAGENVGFYAIEEGTLAVNSNYDITFLSNNFEIAQKEITVDVDPDQTKIYGEIDPVLSYSVTGTLEGSDDFTGEIARVAGENVGFYEIQQGSLVLTSNYDIVFNSTNFEILPQSITVTVNTGQTKIYNEADPIFTYTLTEELETGDEFIGELLREPGEDVGLYVIEQGTLDVSANYDITFNSDNFEITKAYPIITWENPADIYTETELSATQLNASADTEGSYVYDPILGTILPVGDNQALNVEFTPTDNLNYFNIGATVYINVLLGSSTHTNVESFVSIYPNPTIGLVNLDFGDNLGANIRIADITGKVIYEQSNPKSFETIDLSNQASGLYFISFDVEGQVYSTRIIKR